jgi:putative ABC transport system permease protein
MDLRESIRMAGIDIRLNKMRTALSVLGIVIGIASVIIIVSIGNGLKYKIMEQFTGMGADRLMVSAGWDFKTGRQGEITIGDIATIQSVPGVIAVTPQAMGNEDVKKGTRSKKMSLRGVPEDFISISGLKVEYGRDLTRMDIEERQKVCILKFESAQNLFGNDTSSAALTSGKLTFRPENVLGEYIQISGMRFLVVGILSYDDVARGFGEMNSNDIIMPVTVLMRMAQLRSYPMVTVQVSDIKESKKIADNIKKTLLERHDKKGNYDIFNPIDIQKQIDKVVTIFTSVLGAIGGLSLLVGGIGIMNVMLATVAERTREIGIRKAIGAKRRDVLIQFIIEAGTLTGVGGIIGIILGTILAKSITVLTQNNIPSVILPSSAIVAFLFSVVVGMLFGIYPASKAANLNPIEALRYE